MLDLVHAWTTDTGLGIPDPPGLDTA